MKLGFLTACMPERELESIASWAAGAGYETLELAAWPALGDRPFTASHVAADRFDPAEAERVMGALERNGLGLSALAYYDNCLHPDRAERDAVHAQVRACIDAAAELGGRARGHVHRPRPRPERGREPEGGGAGLPSAGRPRGAARRQADDRELRDGGLAPGRRPGNLAYSPELWEWMFGLGLYLNYDPSHLLWLGIDPIEALRPYVDRVVHAHAKDAETFPAQRNRYGFFGKQEGRDEDPWDMGWWRYRIPGLGEIDFPSYVDTLYEGGFEGVLSVEHEDPVWGGTPEKVEVGLRIAHRNLRPLVVG